MARSERAALGLSIHTGWAACVAASGTLRAPRIVARERIELLPDPDRFVFHRAAELTPAAAERAVALARRAAIARGTAALKRVLTDLRAGGCDPVACAIVAKDGAMPASLADIVGAHPRIHTAEGAFYRDVAGSAAEANGLPTRVVPPGQIDRLAVAAMRMEPSQVATLLAQAGRAAGRPWAKDQKLAALAAWTVLAG
ncbi:MAG TPA: hypothetical protein VIF09_02820 [Polyangiaceae bacterium]|jgi:hypothetical protein